MARHYKLIIRDGKEQELHVEHFTCRREQTAKAHGAKIMAEKHGTVAVLEYAALGPRHRKYLFNGIWRNDYHHEKAFAAHNPMADAIIWASENPAEFQKIMNAVRVTYS